MDIAVRLLVALVAGGVCGSLINVVATRLPADLPVVGPPVRPGATTPDRRGLVPLLGAWAPGGGWDLPKLGTELGAVAAVLAALLAQGWTFAGLRGAVFAMILLLILRIDWQNHLIYMITIIPGVVVALALNAVSSLHDLLSAGAAGLAAAFVFLLLFLVAVAIYKKRALGFGDVLLAGLIGAMTGLGGVASALMLGMFLAAAGGLFLIAIRVRSRTDYIPYGAYLSLGALIVVLLQR